MAYSCQTCSSFLLVAAWRLNYSSSRIFCSHRNLHCIPKGDLNKYAASKLHSCMLTNTYCIGPCMCKLIAIYVKPTLQIHLSFHLMYSLMWQTDTSHLIMSYTTDNLVSIQSGHTHLSNSSIKEPSCNSKQLMTAADTQMIQVKPNSWFRYIFTRHLQQEYTQLRIISRESDLSQPLFDCQSSALNRPHTLRQGLRCSIFRWTMEELVVNLVIVLQCHIVCVISCRSSQSASAKALRLYAGIHMHATPKAALS